MEKQLSLFPNLETDSQPKIVNEKEAKAEAANLLQVLLEQGFVNVHKEDISDEHLRTLIKTLKEE